ncbi:hypothetical protein F5Y03DRAFT_32199 [Xylaria venustula]|nr:hypothetical protein F5Y03DRAFT_32199 [Xylaria venustula]
MENSGDRFQRLWKSVPASAWSWFLTAKVPLPGLLGVPALYYVLTNHEQLTAAAGMAGTFMTQLAVFLISIPIALVQFVFIRCCVPIPLLRFVRGFLRGLDTALGRFWRDVYLVDRGYGEGHWGLVEADGDDAGSDDGYVLVGQRDWEGMERDENRRTGAYPNTITNELTSWAPYISQTTWALFWTALLLLLLYIACNYLFDPNGYCGTSALCGGSGGQGEYTCLSTDEVIRLARERAPATRPWRYRVLVDGTRKMFPRP